MNAPYGPKAALVQVFAGAVVVIFALVDLAVGNAFRGIAEAILGGSVLAKGCIETFGSHGAGERLYGHVVAGVGFATLAAYLLGLAIYQGSNGGGTPAVRQDVGGAAVFGVLAYVLAKNSDPRWTGRQLERALERTQRGSAVRGKVGDEPTDGGPAK